MMKLVDLHTHSNISDGACRPSEVVDMAADAGLCALSLTDHETIAGTAEARARAKERGLDFMIGMEMTVSYRNRRLHIVALGFDEECAAFREVYRKIRRSKESGMEIVIERIVRQGVDITPEILRPFLMGDKLDRYAIMRYFVSLQKYDDVQKIWDNHINPALAGTSENIDAEEAIGAIAKAGGVTSLAHFHKRIGLLGLSRPEQEAAVKELLKMGLDGMEAHYPNYTEEDRAFAAYLIDKYRMLPTGGTDFHGSNRPNVNIGTGTDGNIAVPYSIYEAVAERCGERAKHLK